MSKKHYNLTFYYKIYFKLLLEQNKYLMYKYFVYYVIKERSITK